MKVFKGFLTVTSCTLLSVIVFGLSLTYTVKSFVIKEATPNIIKELLRTEYVKTNKLDSHKLEVLDRVFYDKDTAITIEIIVDNFLDYQNNKSTYKVKENDLSKVREFMVKHREDLIDFSSEKLTEKEIIDHFQVEVINGEVIDIFEKVDKDLNKTEKLVFEIYDKATSNTTRTIMIAAMIVLASLIALLNLPITKSFGKMGVSVLISGLVLALIYGVLIVLRDKVVSTLGLDLDLSNIKFNIFLIWSAAEIAIGTVLIVLKKLLFKKVV